MPMRRVPLPPDRDPGDLVDEAVAALRAGRVLVLPSETVYGFAVDPRNPAAVEQVRRMTGRAPGTALTLHLADRDALDAMVPPPPRRVRRLLERYWPGPLTAVLPGADGGGVRLRVPAHDFTRAVIRAAGTGIHLVHAAPADRGLLCGAEDFAAVFADAIDLLVDAGPPPLAQLSTVVRLVPAGPTVPGPRTAPTSAEFGELELLRVGTLSAQDVWAAAARRILFVCTGNTCRSPLAAALARRATARLLGTSDERVLAHGLSFESAGVAAFPGEPASRGSLAAAAEVGIALDEHRSAALDREQIEGAARVFCLGPSHLAAARALAPQRAADIELLDPGGAGIPDPFGGALDDYRRTRAAIERALDRRLDEIFAAIAAG
jgi:tRNA threonylcarbamoyl adenosine modification protein (Sua5/YciO/YrdC/YwlC family)